MGLLLLAAAPIVGCSSTVRPPPTPADPVRVFLLSEALHTGLVLPPDQGAGNQEFVEFGFGDWNWYALGNDAWYNVFATVLWPTQGGLGRRTFGARTEAELLQGVTWAELAPVTVERGKAAALRAQLQATFEQRLADAVWQPRYSFRFVPSDDSYWFGHNCADAATTWLRALDCSVGGALLRTGLRVATD
ncbi:MAG: DUF2459 domain-containing protein [Planctomycetes bacterium]|nr:DUF2459 domain-containing protein [Planctomycetota bacterium]